MTGPEYVVNLHREGVSFVPYEELKKNVGRMMAESFEPAQVEAERAAALEFESILKRLSQFAKNRNLKASL